MVTAVALLKRDLKKHLATHKSITIENLTKKKTMKSEDTSIVIKEKTETGNVKFKMLKKERVIRVSIKTVIFINLKYLLKEYNQLPVIQLQVSVRKCYFLALVIWKTCELENLIFEGKIYLTSFPCAKARKSRQHTIHVLEDKQL